MWRTKSKSRRDSPYLSRNSHCVTEIADIVDVQKESLANTFMYGEAFRVGRDIIVISAK